MTESSVSLGLAFLAGLVSFFSPCVLPIVPGYLGFITGLTLEELQEPASVLQRRRVMGRAALFVLGFSLLFVALGATATALGAALREWLPLLQRLGGAVLVLFGLHLAGLLAVAPLLRERRLRISAPPARALGAFGAGVAFAAGWTPCIGPVLASVLFFAGTMETMGRGLALLTAYSLGMALPFLAAAAAFDAFLAHSRLIRAWARPLQRGAGGVLVLIGGLLLTGHFARLTGFLARYTPVIEGAY